MKNIVGTPAIGDNFFKRENEIMKISSRLEAGNNLQIAAPRRVGKTSILHYLKDNQIGGHLYVYVDTERINNEQDFYKKLLKSIVKSDPIARSQKLSKLLSQGLKHFKKLKSIKILGNGIDFNEETETKDYYEEINIFLSGLELEENKRLILLIDEFPQTILNIVEANNGETQQAINFLQSNRELRINPDLIGKVQFVYTGSIGLNHTVTAINASAFVNDLNSTEVEPLSLPEARQLIAILLQEKNINIGKKAVSHLLDKISWLIPFHIQLAAQEIGTVSQRTKLANIDTVNSAFESMVASRNHSHFEHYYSRLKRQFKGKEFAYAELILQLTANKGSISIAQVYDLAVAHDVKNSYRKIVEILCYDGYINNNGDKHIFRFNSPLVQLWWQKFICN